MEALKAGNALVVYSLSRLSRSTKDTIELSDLLSKKKADLISLSEKIDTTSASGKMIFRMLAVLNEFERDQISERTKTALSYKKAKNERTGTVKFGYKLDSDNKTLIPDEHEQNIIKTAIQYRNKGLSLRKIAEEMSKKGIVSKRSNKTLSHIQIKRILDNVA